MCTASNRLRGDTTARATALAPDVVTFADVITNRANAAQSLFASSVVRDTSNDVATTAIESHVDVDIVDVNDYDYADIHVPRYVQSKHNLFIPPRDTSPSHTSSHDSNILRTRSYNTHSQYISQHLPTRRLNPPCDVHLIYPDFLGTKDKG